MSLLSSIFDLLRFNKKNWRAVILCIMAATIFWFFNALNKNYTTNISFPLVFEYDKLYYIPVRPLPDEVRVNVTGNGWDLFRRSVRLKVLPLVIPLERPVDVRKIVGSTLPALFSNQLDRLQINFVVTDTVYIDFEPKVKRWLTLKVDSPEKYLRDNYCMVGEISIAPDSIFIEGPLKTIIHLQEPYNLMLGTQTIDENYAEDVEVKFPGSELITRNPPTVSVSFDVAKAMEASNKIKLEIVNIPQTSNPQINAKEIAITIRGPQPFVQAFRWSSVHASIDLKTLKRGITKMIPEITGVPKPIQVIKLDTIHITY